MLNQQMFSKTEFAQFVIAHAQKLDPALQFEAVKMEDPFQFNVTHTKQDMKALVNLHNLWEDYTRIGDLNTVIDFINHQFQTTQYIERISSDFKGIDLAKIYPAIRPHDFRIHQAQFEDMLYDDQIVSRLDTMFIENHIGYYVFLTKQLIKPVLVYKDEQEIKAQAFDNLRSRGWLSPIMGMPALNFRHNGQLHVYQKTDYPFQHQFFLADMVKDQLPDTFLMSMPARDMAVVHTCDKPIDSVAAARKIAAHSGLREFVSKCYHGEPRPISENIYWSQDGRMYCLP